MAKKVKSMKKKRKKYEIAVADGKLVRVYLGVEHVVTVKDGTFEYEGIIYPSLSAVAKDITGWGAINGPAFFRLIDSVKWGKAI